jgi:hypothetical protein
VRARLQDVGRWCYTILPSANNNARSHSLSAGKTLTLCVRACRVCFVLISRPGRRIKILLRLLARSSLYQGKHNPTFRSRRFAHKFGCRATKFLERAIRYINNNCITLAALAFVLLKHQLVCVFLQSTDT